MRRVTGLGLGLGLIVLMMAGPGMAQNGETGNSSAGWMIEVLKSQRNQTADVSAGLAVRLQMQEIELAKARAGAMASDGWWHKCVNDPGCVAWSTGAGVVPAPNSSGVAAPKEQK